ncbi:hypothetical protein DHD08_17960 [Arenibacter sp. H213]|nr:hypothetical protein [Arenibacter sp. H213]
MLRKETAPTGPAEVLGWHLPAHVAVRLIKDLNPATTRIEVVEAPLLREPLLQEVLLAQIGHLAVT